MGRDKEFFEKSPINHFRARVEMELARRNMSIAAIARSIRKTPQHVGAVVDRGNPKTSALREIAEAIGVEPGVLLNEVTAQEYGEVMIPRITS